MAEATRHHDHASAGLLGPLMPSNGIVGDPPAVDMLLWLASLALQTPI